MSRALRSLLVATLLALGLLVAPVSSYSHPTDVAVAAGNYIYNSPISGHAVMVRTISGVWLTLAPGQGRSAVNAFRTFNGYNADWVDLHDPLKRFTCHSGTYCLISTTMSAQINKVYAVAPPGGGLLVGR